jgi:hypothetical protein
MISKRQSVHNPLIKDKGSKRHLYDLVAKSSEEPKELSITRKDSSGHIADSR